MALQTNTRCNGFWYEEQVTEELLLRMVFKKVSRDTGTVHISPPPSISLPTTHCSMPRTACPRPSAPSPGGLTRPVVLRQAISLVSAFAGDVRLCF
jgi:hypothetical protein